MDQFWTVFESLDNKINFSIILAIVMVLVSIGNALKNISFIKLVLYIYHKFKYSFGSRTNQDLKLNQF